MTSKNIYQRINEVQKEISYLQKDKRVETGGGKSYSALSHDKLVGELRALLVKHGIVAIPKIKDHALDRHVSIGEYKGQPVEKVSYFTRLMLQVELVNIDDPNDKVVADSFGYGIDNQDKGAGKSFSYGFKYALLKTFLIESGDEEESRQPEEYMPTDYKQKSALILAIQSELSRQTAGKTLEQKSAYLLDVCKVSQFKELNSKSVEDLQKILDALREKILEASK